MKLGVRSGKGARCVRGLHKAAGRTGIHLETKGHGRFHDVIPSQIIPDRVETSGV